MSIHEYIRVYDIQYTNMHEYDNIDNAKKRISYFNYMYVYVAMVTTC